MGQGIITGQALVIFRPGAEQLCMELAPVYTLLAERGGPGNTAL